MDRSNRLANVAALLCEALDLRAKLCTAWFMLDTPHLLMIAQLQAKLDQSVIGECHSTIICRVQIVCCQSLIRV